jgi:hypothetical protein
MDTMGDADLLADDEDDFPPQRQPFLTAETRAVAGAGLVLMSVFSTAVFQYAAFLLFEGSDGSAMGRTNQYLLLAGPTALMAAAGAGLGWSTRNRAMSPGLRGVAGAAVLVGAIIVLSVAVTTVGGYLWGGEQTQDF